MFSMAIAYWLLYQALCSYRPQHSSCDVKTLEPKRLLTYAETDLELSRFEICAHLLKDRERGRMCNYLIFEQGVMSVFAPDLVWEPARLVWNTPLPCPPCYIHSLAMTESYAVFIRNVRRSRISIPMLLRLAVPKWNELANGWLAWPWTLVIQQNRSWKRLNMIDKPRHHSLCLTRLMVNSVSLSSAILIIDANSGD